jgi:protein-disulfide isomerase
MNSETKVISIILAITALVIIVGLSLTKSNGAKSGIELNSNILIASTTPIQGNKNASVSIVEFADFACPACAMLHPNLTTALAPYTGAGASSSTSTPSVSYALRLIPIHGNDSIFSAMAAFAAGKENKFFEMGSILLEKQTEWAGKPETRQKELFIGYAQTLGLNIQSFAALLDSPNFKKEITTILTADNADAAKMNIASTPTLIINGTKVIVGVQSTETLKKTIEAEIKAAQLQ